MAQQPGMADGAGPGGASEPQHLLPPGCSNLCSTKATESWPSPAPAEADQIHGNFPQHNPVEE